MHGDVINVIGDRAWQGSDAGYVLYFFDLILCLPNSCQYASFLQIRDICALSYLMQKVPRYLRRLPKHGI